MAIILTIFSDMSRPSDFLLGALSNIRIVEVPSHSDYFSSCENPLKRRKHTVGKEIKNVRRGRGPCPELAGVFQVLIRKYRDQLETVSRNIISTSANFRRESTFADLTLVVEGAQVGMTKNTLL